MCSVTGQWLMMVCVLFRIHPGYHVNAAGCATCGDGSNPRCESHHLCHHHIQPLIFLLLPSSLLSFISPRLLTPSSLPHSLPPSQLMNYEAPSMVTGEDYKELEEEVLHTVTSHTLTHAHPHTHTLAHAHPHTCTPPHTAQA